MLRGKVGLQWCCTLVTQTGFGFEVIVCDVCHLAGTAAAVAVAASAGAAAAVGVAATVAAVVEEVELPPLN